MLIPRHVLSAIARACDSYSGRYALNSVQVTREGSKCTAAATNGKILLAAEWTETCHDEIDKFGTDDPKKQKKSFTKLIPTAVIKLAKQMAKPTKYWAKKSPWTRNWLVSEVSPDNKVTIAAGNITRVDAISSAAGDGKFPMWQAVVPAKHGKPRCFDARLLAQTLLAVADATPGTVPAWVDIYVPEGLHDSLLIERTCDGVTVRGVVMPNVDLNK